MTSNLIVERPRQVLFPYSPPLELVFEEQILRCRVELFPNFHVARWKPRVRDYRGTVAQPDIVLVSHDLQIWYVGEIELTSDPLDRVGAQLETLAGGIYDRSLVPSLVASLPDLPEEALHKLISSKRPGFLCVAEAYTEALHRLCRSMDFEFAVAEPYQGGQANWALVVSRMPSALRAAPQPGRYQLRRGPILGNREFMVLPPHFPPHDGPVYILDALGNPQRCQVTPGNPRTIAVLTAMLRMGKSFCLVSLNPDTKQYKLEVQD